MMTPRQKVFMKNFMNDFIKLQEQFYIPQSTPEYWDNIYEQSLALIARNKTEDERQNQFCEDMVLAFLKTRQ